MDFFGLGFGEILLIVVITLLIFGPEKIPGIARTLGRTVHAFRQATSGFTTAITRELEEEEKKGHAAQSRGGGEAKPSEPSNVNTHQQEPKSNE